MAKKPEADEVQVIKKKPRGGNSPVIGDNGLETLPGDNAKYMRVNMVLFNMEKVDLNDVEAVRNRLNEYFALYTENDMKPTVAGMAMALGIDRRTLWAIRNDQPANGQGWKYTLPTAVSDSIKKAYILMENLWEIYMNSGKINPVSGIFLGKNNYGYQDKTEYVLTPNNQQDNDYDPEDIKKRYLIDSTSDSDSDSENE